MTMGAEMRTLLTYSSEPNAAGALATLIFIWVAGIILHLVLCHFIAKAAQRKGRSYAAFWCISFFFSEPIAFIIVATLAEPQLPNQLAAGNSLQEQIQAVTPRWTNPKQSQAITVATCPFCAEEVMPAAILCKHCKSNITPIVRELDSSVFFESSESEIDQTNSKSTESDSVKSLDREFGGSAYQANYLLARKMMSKKDFSEFLRAGEPPIKDWIDRGRPHLPSWLAEQPKDYWE